MIGLINVLRDRLIYNRHKYYIIFNKIDELTKVFNRLNMASPGEKLAASLKELRQLQEKDKIVAIRSSEINRTHRERLSKNGFLKEVSRGWYIVTNPEDRQGDSTSWYTSYWNFCSRYLEDKYKSEYCISPEQSLLLHVGNKAVPKQLITKSPNGPNKVIPLLHDKVY